ncbi:MAG: hypothetical protein ACK4U0_02225 [Mesorhizobium sp.]
MTNAAALQRILTAVLAVSLPAGGAALAQEPASAPSLRLEFNGLEPSSAGCRLTFVVENGLGASLDRAAFEIVLFNRDGLVDRLTVLDFKDLPAGKTKVRQFDLQNADCAGIGRVLVNDAVACEGEGVEPSACIRGLNAETKSDISFGS